MSVGLTLGYQSFLVRKLSRKSKLGTKHPHAKGFIVETALSPSRRGFGLLCQKGSLLPDTECGERAVNRIGGRFFYCNKWKRGGNGCSQRSIRLTDSSRPGVDCVICGTNVVEQPASGHCTEEDSNEFESEGDSIRHAFKMPLQISLPLAPYLHLATSLGPCLALTQ